MVKVKLVQNESQLLDINAMAEKNQQQQIFKLIIQMCQFVIIRNYYYSDYCQFCYYYYCYFLFAYNCYNCYLCYNSCLLFSYYCCKIACHIIKKKHQQRKLDSKEDKKMAMVLAMEYDHTQQRKQGEWLLIATENIQ